MEPLGFSLEDLYRLMLILFRAGALLMTVPVFGHVSIPRMLRLWLVLISAFLLFSSTMVSEISLPRTTVELAVVILSELAVGFAIGFTVIILFAAVQFAGHLIGLQMGLAVASIMDPMSSAQISIVGEFYYLFSIVIFLLIDGHHFVIEAMAQSFELIPIGGGVFSGGLGEQIIAMTGTLFVVAVKMAAPLMITLFIVNIILGIIAKTVPQMNVFVVGFPLALGVGLLMVRFSLPFFRTVFVDAFIVFEGDVLRLIALLRG